MSGCCEHCDEPAENLSTCGMSNFPEELSSTQLVSSTCMSACKKPIMLTKKYLCGNVNTNAVP